MVDYIASLYSRLTSASLHTAVTAEGQGGTVVLATAFSRASTTAASACCMRSSSAGKYTRRSPNRAAAARVWTMLVGVQHLPRGEEREFEDQILHKLD